MGRLLSGWYLATPLFALLDFATGVNLRTAFIADPVLRALYYAASFGLGVVTWLRPGLAPMLGMVESGLNVLLVMVGLYTRIWGATAGLGLEDGSSVQVPMNLVVNAGVSGLVFAASFYGNQARLIGEGKLQRYDS